MKLPSLPNAGLRRLRRRETGVGRARWGTTGAKWDLLCILPNTGPAGAQGGQCGRGIPDQWRNGSVGPVGKEVTIVAEGGEVSGFRIRIQSELQPPILS